ncbi:integral membrane protein [Streptomyces hygroscopicus subsp. jinggangensis 5008]|nr:integral membrane protein [Streptomyces hygroscopicus subsp. jinggangensis 5008]AGF65369.1 integral membrane protein [Streptomyces hygroscopicus subsp. jinggangensis TL01]
MSFGDPNNPYGPPQGQQAGYGYPQQQPGYGYPAAPGFQQPGYGYPAGPAQMPGGVKAARVFLWILGVCQALAGLLLVVGSAMFADRIRDAISSDSSVSSTDADKAASIGVGVMIVFGVIVLAFAFWAIFTAVKFAGGRGGARVSAIIYGSVVTLISLVTLLGGNFLALISLVLSILIIVFCANKAGGSWFNRPQY